MGTDDDLNKIRRKVYISFFQDGLWDIFLGLFILGWGVTIITDWTYLPGVLFIVLYFAIWGIKKWLTYPRLGYVRFSSQSKRVHGKFFLLLSVILLLGIMIAVLWGVSSRPQWILDYFPLAFNGMMAIVICIIAFWFRVNRFYLYALLIFIGAVLHQWLAIPWMLSFIGSGGIIVLVGLVILIRFLYKYPHPVEEISDEEK